MANVLRNSSRTSISSAGIALSCAFAIGSCNSSGLRVSSVRDAGASGGNAHPVGTGGSAGSGGNASAPAPPSTGGNTASATSAGTQPVGTPDAAPDAPCPRCDADARGTVGGAGGSTGGTDNANTGGSTSTATGGSNSAGGSSTACTATRYPDCSLTSGVVTGNACKPNPPILAIDASCKIGFWANDNNSSGYFYQPWCNSPTAGDCNLTMTCATNSIHITGSYLGSGGLETVDGNGGWGAFLDTTYPDTGPGCEMIDGAGLAGLTLDANIATLPAGNHLDIGITLANGNTADYQAVLTAGTQTVRIPWACFKNDRLCGSIPGPGITSFYFAFDWFNDRGATHLVDITISNLGFY